MKNKINKERTKERRQKKMKKKKKKNKKKKKKNNKKKKEKLWKEASRGALLLKSSPRVFSEGCSELGLYLKSLGSRVVESSPCMVIGDCCQVGMVATVVVVVLSCL